MAVVSLGLPPRPRATARDQLQSLCRQYDREVRSLREDVRRAQSHGGMALTIRTAEVEAARPFRILAADVCREHEREVAELRRELALLRAASQGEHAAKPSVCTECLRGMGERPDDLISQVSTADTVRPDVRLSSWHRNSSKACESASEEAQFARQICSQLAWEFGAAEDAPSPQAETAESESSWGRRSSSSVPSWEKAAAEPVPLPPNCPFRPGKAPCNERPPRGDSRRPHRR